MPLYEINGRIPVVGEGTWIAPSAEIIGDVRIGRNCYIGFGAVLRGDWGPIIIGDETAVEEQVMVHARPTEKAEFGRRVTIGHLAMIHSCTLKDFCLIGMHATVSDNAVVGEWAIVAEHALVKSRQVIPDRKIFAGVPAVEIGTVEERHMEHLTLGKQIYVDLTAQYRNGLKRID
jgi:carbonic anhydrase/acetyltransferase-like protein (isoleucine patch superfamily)